MSDAEEKSHAGKSEGHSTAMNMYKIGRKQSEQKRQSNIAIVQANIVLG